MFGTFSFLPPHTSQDDVFAINYMSIAFPIKQFSFKLILSDSLGLDKTLFTFFPYVVPQF